MLSNREKYLIGLLVVAVASAVFYFAFRSLDGIESRLATQIASRRSTLLQTQALSLELARLKSKPQGNRLKEPLIGYVEKIAKRAQVADRIQLNLIPQDKEKKIETVEVKVASLNLDEMVNLVYSIENSNAPMVIDQFEISPSFRSKTLLRLSMRVSARK